MKKKQERDRKRAIDCYLKGESISAIAIKLGYSRPWVYKWVERYQSRREGQEWQEEFARQVKLLKKYTASPAPKFPATRGRGVAASRNALGSMAAAQPHYTDT